MTEAHRSPEPAVLEGVTKRFGSVAALIGLHLRVRQGEVVGLLGPNGAGKSTAVKVLLGLVHPTSGEARLFGRTSTDPSARTNVGYLPELFRFPAWMTGRQLLRHHGKLAGVGTETVESQIPGVLELVGMSRRADRRIGTYSKGMSQRIGIAQAMLGDPRLIVLDEPTSALDPVGRREVRHIITVLREQGIAVLLNSHLLTEVEQVCDRVAVIDRGSLVFEGELTELTARSNRYELRVDRTAPDLVTRLRSFGTVEVVDSERVEVTLTDLEHVSDLAVAVLESGRRLLALTPAGGTLEDVFVTMVAGGDR